MTANSKHPSGHSRQRRGAIANHWVRAMWPVVGVLAAGVLWFAEPIRLSIESTPHPSLVYTIFAVLAAAVLLAAHTLARYVHEESLALALRHAEPEQRQDVLKAAGSTDMLPVYQLALSSDPATQRHAHQQKIEAELFAAEEHLFSRLTLPNYLGGALVGVGLVGTFVGLLGSLADLGSLFASLMNAGSASSDPVAMFSDMLRRLQEPMKGMGTAFVASLYGLMGSLIMGLVTYSVRKSGARAVVRVRELLRLLALEQPQDTAEEANTPHSEAAWSQLLTTMQAERHTLAHSLNEFLQLLRQQAAVQEGLGAQLREAHQQNAHLADTLSRLEGLERQLGQGQEHVTQYLEQAEQRQVQAHTALLKALTRFDPPPQQRLVVGALWLIASCALLAVGSTYLNYRLNIQLNEQIVAQIHPQISPSQVPASAAGTPVVTQVPTRTVTVQSGDTLDSVARQHGFRVEDMLAANPSLKNPNLLQIGQTLSLPQVAQPKP